MMQLAWGRNESGLTRDGANDSDSRQSAERNAAVQHLLLLDELDEGAEGGLRVYERDCGAAAPGARRLVDHLVALRLHPCECRGAVVDPVADVVQPLAPLLEVLRDR